MTLKQILAQYRRRARRIAEKRGLACPVEDVFGEGIPNARGFRHFEHRPCGRPAIAPPDDRRPDGGGLCAIHALPMSFDALGLKAELLRKEFDPW